jgi:DNA-directed RNA polymerase subunit M/transcription elongation factor TFIIS
MRNGTCPKCGSQQIYARQASGERNLISHDWSGESELMIVDYVCGSCGCIETFVKLADLAHISASDAWQPLDKLNLEKEGGSTTMHNGRCPKCDSAEVYGRQAVGALFGKCD